MDAAVMFLDCPEYLDRQGAVRCGLPAEVEYRYTLGSSDGPMEGVRIRCPRGHWFNGPVESLIIPAVLSAAVCGAADQKRPGHHPRGRSHGPRLPLA
jgi:hypothetical protein